MMQMRLTRQWHTTVWLSAFSLGLIISTAFVACGGDEDTSQDAAEAADWSYSGAGAPQNWASLSDEWTTCDSGTLQSPIDIADYGTGDAPPLSFSFRRDPTEITNDGRLVSVNYPSGNRLGLSERTYQLAEARWHAPGEHTIDGEAFAAELQLVHKQTFGDVAIVSFLYRIGDADPTLETLLNLAPESGASITAEGDELATLNAENFVPDDLGYYKYEGSRTIPPCDEPVDWFVMLQIGTVSQAQIDSLKDLTGGANTNRPIQAAAGREIITSGSRK